MPQGLIASLPHSLIILPPPCPFGLHLMTYIPLPHHTPFSSNSCFMQNYFILQLSLHFHHRPIVTGMKTRRRPAVHNFQTLTPKTKRSSAISPLEPESVEKAWKKDQIQQSMSSTSVELYTTTGSTGQQDNRTEQQQPQHKCINARIPKTTQAHYMISPQITTMAAHCQTSAT